MDDGEGMLVEFVRVDHPVLVAALGTGVRSSGKQQRMQCEKHWPKQSSPSNAVVTSTVDLGFQVDI